MIADYELLQAPNATLLGKKVQDKLRDGWQLYGNAFAVTTDYGVVYFNQAVTLDDQSRKSYGTAKLVEGMRMLHNELLKTLPDEVRPTVMALVIGLELKLENELLFGSGSKPTLSR